MSETFVGKVQVQSKPNVTKITLDGEAGTVHVRTPSITKGGGITLSAESGSDGKLNEITLGGGRRSSQIVLNDKTNKKRVWMKSDGRPLIQGAISSIRAVLDGANAIFGLGGSGKAGDVRLFNKKGNLTVTVDAQKQHLHMMSETGKKRLRLEGNEGNLWLGGNDEDGDLVLFDGNGDNKSRSQATIHLDGEGANIRLGGKVKDGKGKDGDLLLFAKDAPNKNRTTASIHLDGDSGNIRCNDVIIPGADFAEDFDIDSATATTLEPGTVMVLGKDGKLHESTQAFDHKVAGVVSGAGKYNAGITLDKQPNSENRMPIALSGKVMCKIDANYGSIEVGDLITTSPRKGYAMKAEDPIKSFGAVIGKALADFPNGDGMLPILVALQ